ncbi:MAG: hypothetical protein EA361_10870 [Bacteroidetes bacterium]|nr:MAG: hypothetical protein EA361_10870 [Bacteroidota bacterium]
MQNYSSIKEIRDHDFRHIIAGAFFQMQKSCISRLPEINLLVSGDVLYVDVYPVDTHHQLLLSAHERIGLLRQLGTEHYLAVSSTEWPEVLNELRKRNTCSQGIYKGPFFLSGLGEKGTDISLLKNFLSLAFSDTGVFNWQKHLGYYFPLRGKVVYGNKIGRTLGYPTLNIEPHDSRKLIPPMGVYTGLIKHNGQWFKTMINIGIRPTLDLSKVTIEAHVFGFSKEIYGEDITLHFAGRIRDEMRFPSLDELKKQLKIDQKDALLNLEKENIKTSRDDEFLILS